MLLHSINLNIFQHSCHNWFLSFKIFWALICDLIYDLFWRRMHHVHLRRMYILLLSIVFCICLLYLVGLCVAQLLFPYSSSSGCFIYYLEWHIDISNCYFELFICPFNSVSFGFRLFDLFLGVNLYNYASFCCVESLLIYWYIISFVSCKLLWFKVYYIL